MLKYLSFAKAVELFGALFVLVEIFADNNSTRSKISVTEHTLCFCRCHVDIVIKINMKLYHLGRIY